MLYLNLLLCAVGAYLLGSIPTAYLMGRFIRGVDIRRHGSGNVGATNVIRVLGTGPGLVTLGVDFLKGCLAVVLIAPLFSSGGEVIHALRIAAAVAAITGHNWMLFLRFKGGKGIATTAGAFAALAPAATGVAFGIWAITVVITRFVSLGSIVAMVALPIFMWGFGEPAGSVIFSLLIAALGIFKHRSNIRRLVAGRENRIGRRNETAK